MKKSFLLALAFTLVAAPSAWSQTKKAGVSTSKFAFQSMPANIVEMSQSPTDVYFTTENSVFALNKATGKLRVVIPEGSKERGEINSVALHPKLGLLFFVSRKGLYAYDGKSVESSPLLYTYGENAQFLSRTKILVAPDESIILWGDAYFGNGARVLEPDGKTVRHAINTSSRILPMSEGRYVVLAYDTDAHLYQGGTLVAEYVGHNGAKTPKVFNDIGSIAVSSSGDSLYYHSYNTIYLLEKGAKEFKVVKQLTPEDKYSIRGLLPLADGGFALIPGGNGDTKSFVFFDKDFSGSGTGGKAITSEVPNLDQSGPKYPFVFTVNDYRASKVPPVVDQHGNFYMMHTPIHPSITQLYIYNPKGIRGLDAIKGRYGQYVAPTAAK